MKAEFEPSTDVTNGAPIFTPASDEVFVCICFSLQVALAALGEIWQKQHLLVKNDVSIAHSNRF